MNFELELLTTTIIVSSVLHIKAEYNGAQHSGNPYYERSGQGERHLQLELPQTLFAACGAILFLISDALRLESISDGIQIRVIFNQWYLTM